MADLAVPHPDCVAPENKTSSGFSYVLWACSGRTWDHTSSVSPTILATNEPLWSVGLPVCSDGCCCWTDELPPPATISPPLIRMRGSMPSAQPIKPRIRIVPIPSPPLPRPPPSPPPLPRRSSMFVEALRSSSCMGALLWTTRPTPQAAYGQCRSVAKSCSKQDGRARAGRTKCVPNQAIFCAQKGSARRLRTPGSCPKRRASHVNWCEPQWSLQPTRKHKTSSSSTNSRQRHCWRDGNLRRQL